jgi:hypothetical protein
MDAVTIVALSKRDKTVCVNVQQDSAKRYNVTCCGR